MVCVPEALTKQLSEEQLSTDRDWWTSLTDQQRISISRLLSKQEHPKLSDAEESEPVRRDPKTDADDDWMETWESDWREYLTEHGDVRVATLEFLSYRTRVGRN